MVLRATRDLAAGEELLVDYHEPLEQRKRQEEEANGKDKRKEKGKGGGTDGAGSGGGGGASKWPTREEYLRQKGVEGCKGVSSAAPRR